MHFSLCSGCLNSGNLEIALDLREVLVTINHGLIQPCKCIVNTGKFCVMHLLTATCQVAVVFLVHPSKRFETTFSISSLYLLLLNIYSTATLYMREVSKYRRFRRLVAPAKS